MYIELSHTDRTATRHSNPTFGLQQWNELH